MSSEDKRKCFTFLWIIENISYSWQETGMAIKSPKFKIGEMMGSIFQLSLFPRGSMESHENYIAFYLNREGGIRNVKLDCELSFLSMDNVVLASMKFANMTFSAGSREFKERKHLFFYNRSAYLSQDKLRARCRIWKIEEGITEDVQCFARTRICIERTSFLWNIKNFSSLFGDAKSSKQIKSVSDDEVLITFHLFVHDGNSEEDPISLKLVSNNQKVKYFVLHLTALNEIIRNQSVFHDANEVKLITLPFSKKKLFANKKLCLPNDVLSFRGECVYSTGKVLKEIERVVYCSESFRTREADSHFLDEGNLLSISKRTLHENLTSLFHDNILPDIKLKTSSEIYLAHKSVLSARSPVFKAMFSNNMKEKNSDCVNIEDLDSDTVHRMLHYVYTAEIKDIQFESAYELYKAADKYEILTLKDQCSAYLKCNFSPSNVCETLILADTHQDRDLKTAAQDFIYEHDVINTEQWKQLLGTHLKLAADMMFYQIQKAKNKWVPIVARFDSNTVRRDNCACVRNFHPLSVEVSTGEPSSLAAESVDNIGGPSSLSPEPDVDPICIISPSGTLFNFSTGRTHICRRRLHKSVRSLPRPYPRSNSHNPNAVSLLESLGSLSAAFASNARPSFLSSESSGSSSGNSAPSEFEASSGTAHPTGVGRILENLNRFNARREEQSKR